MSNLTRDFIYQKMIDVFSDKEINFQEAMELINSADLDFLADCANQITLKFWGDKVDVETLVNAKSGRCPEDCSFCSQSSFNTTKIEKYPLLAPEMILAQAETAKEQGANSFCIVCAYRAPPEVDFIQICNTIKLLKERLDIDVNTSLGFMTRKRAEILKKLGVKRYNHNLETSKSMFDKICTTHTYEDRINTAKIVKEVGLELCSGGIIGMGETVEQRIELGISLQSLNPDEVPINMLIGREGTPLFNKYSLSEEEIIRTIATYRFLMPRAILKIAGGREVHLKKNDKKVLKAGANGIISGGYLTTKGNKPLEDIRMLKEIGLRQK
jgi:biotin synthase